MKSGLGETADFYVWQTAILSLRNFDNVMCDLVLTSAPSEWSLGFGIHKGLAFDRDRNL
jgi:hypothetical protein